MNTVDYEVLKSIYLTGFKSQRALSDATTFSLGKINKTIKTLKNVGYLNNELHPTPLADTLIQSFKPDKAIILAAGRGLRMVPLCNDVPKALLDVKGETLIERLICQLHEVGITKIYIVVGYMKEKFEYLINKYNVNLIVNRYFESRNNIFSLKLVLNELDNSYIIPGDIYCQFNPFSSIETYSWYMVADDFTSKSAMMVNRNYELVMAKNGIPGNQEIGIAYVCGEQAKHIRNNLSSIHLPEEYHAFWEQAAMCNKKSVLSAKIVNHENVCDINTHDDLIRCDINSKSLNSEYINIICDSLHITKESISHIASQKSGMTNRSFVFNCADNKYIFRIPGEGTDMLINRQQEFDVYEQIKDKNLCDEIVYINPKNGYKITKFIDNAKNCDPLNQDEVKECMKTLRKFHDMNLQVNHYFDLFEQINYYEKLRNRDSLYDDYTTTKQHVFQLKQYIDSQEKKTCLCHIDSVCDNFIFSNGKTYLIDWEYASMQDPHVDIAMFAIYSLYNKQQVDQLIDCYFNGPCDKSTRLKIYCYVATCGLLWSNWCEYKATLGETFGEYSLYQYRYAKDFYKYFMEETIGE